MQVLLIVSWKLSPPHVAVAVAATCLSCIFAPTVVPETQDVDEDLRYLSNSMGTSPPTHERAMEPKNIFRQLSIRKEDCREGVGECGLLNLPTTCRSLVAIVVKARRLRCSLSFEFGG